MNEKEQIDPARLSALSRLYLGPLRPLDILFCDGRHPVARPDGILSPWQRFCLHILGWPSPAGSHTILYDESLPAPMIENLKENTGRFLGANRDWLRGLRVEFRRTRRLRRKTGALPGGEEPPPVPALIADWENKFRQDLFIINRLYRLRKENLERAPFSAAGLDLPFDLYVREDQARGRTTVRVEEGVLCRQEVNAGTFHSYPNWGAAGLEISQRAVLDESEGPVILGPGVKVRGPAWLRGPLFVGRDSIIDGAQISSSSIGRTCRLGGEISDSIIGNFTNKHHEGFVGHSVVGDWVNLGALTTTSDLKNNYGPVRLQWRGKTIPTGQIKFGSLIGSFSRTSIGTMLNTGTVIGPGAMVMADQVRGLKEVAPFAWGGKPDGRRYQWEKFVRDLTTIMERRGRQPGEQLLWWLKKMYQF